MAEPAATEALPAVLDKIGDPDAKVTSDSLKELAKEIPLSVVVAADASPLG